MNHLGHDPTSRARPFGSLLAGLLIAACGAAPVPSAPSTTPTPVTAASPTPVPSTTTAPRPVPPWSAVHLIAGPGSKATVTVREQLAAKTIETDAVITTDAVSGEIALLFDGTVWNGSKLSVDLRGLRSDQVLRDRWIQIFGLETNKFPAAEFVPQTATGIKYPLPSTGQVDFQLAGQLTLRDTKVPVSWDVSATRGDGKWQGVATTVLNWAELKIQKPQAVITEVVSVHDEIRLEVRLTSDDPAARNCDASHASQFDFWVGTWDITTPGRPEARTSNTVTKVGCEVHEHFTGWFGNRSDYEGRSAARYLPAIGKWQQTYLDNTSVRTPLYYTGSFEGDRFILYLSGADGRSLGRARLVWDKITQDSLTWYVELSNDSGATWKTNNPNAGLVYQRRK